MENVIEIKGLKKKRKRIEDSTKKANKPKPDSKLKKN